MKEMVMNEKNDDEQKEMMMNEKNDDELMKR
jgi:hypothetical protein